MFWEIFIIKFLFFIKIKYSTTDNLIILDSKSDKSSRNKRSSKKDVSTSTEKDDDSTSDKDNANATEDTRSTGTDTSQNCIIHCVLNQMELVSSQLFFLL